MCDLQYINNKPIFEVRWGSLRLAEARWGSDFDIDFDDRRGQCARTSSSELKNGKEVTSCWTLTVCRWVLHTANADCRSVSDTVSSTWSNTWSYSRFNVRVLFGYISGWWSQLVSDNWLTCRFIGIVFELRKVCQHSNCSRFLVLDSAAYSENFWFQETRTSKTLQEHSETFASLKKYLETFKNFKIFGNF